MKKCKIKLGLVDIVNEMIRVHMTRTMEILMKRRILIVEDDNSLAELIKIYLMAEEWETEVAPTGCDAITMMLEDKFDLILLDLLLPDISGLEVCLKIRAYSTIPIIMVTALEGSAHRIYGLNMGADDYIVKPFEPYELIARIKSQFRRTYEYSKKDSEKNDYEREISDLRLSKKTHKAYYKKHNIDLTPKEFEILWLLMEDPDKIYNMNDIHYVIWGDQVLESEVNPVMVHIRRIRSKIEKLGAGSIIATVWGVGYKINV